MKPLLAWDGFILKLLFGTRSDRVVVCLFGWLFVYVLFVSVLGPLELKSLASGSVAASKLDVEMFEHMAISTKPRNVWNCQYVCRGSFSAGPPGKLYLCEHTQKC